MVGELHLNIFWSLVTVSVDSSTDAPPGEQLKLQWYWEEKSLQVGDTQAHLYSSVS